MAATMSSLEALDLGPDGASSLLPSSSETSVLPVVDYRHEARWTKTNEIGQKELEY